MSSFFARTGIEEAGLAAGGAKKCPGDTFLGRGRFHVFPAAARRAADGNAYPQWEEDILQDVLFFCPYGSPLRI